ncbi:hypothetical protein V8E52_008801 [Russula decolorans]
MTPVLHTLACLILSHKLALSVPRSVLPFYMALATVLSNKASDSSSPPVSTLNVMADRFPSSPSQPSPKLRNAMSALTSSWLMHEPPIIGHDSAAYTVTMWPCA